MNASFIVCLFFVVVINTAVAVSIVKREHAALLSGSSDVITDDFVSVRTSKFKIEVKRVKKDGIFAFPIDAKLPAAPVDEKKLTTKEETDWSAAVAKVNQGHYRPDSFNVRVTRNDNDQLCFAFAEGRSDAEFLNVKSKTSKPITREVINDFIADVKALTAKITNEDVKKLVPSLPSIFNTSFNAYMNTAGSKKGGSVAAAALLETGVGAVQYRYDVTIHVGNAFNMPFGGEHSASVVTRVNAATGEILAQFRYNNHGRFEDDKGMREKCTHRGAATIAEDAAQPANWDCTTPYWAVYCPNGPNHNCNAQATHHIQISDNPTAPPASDAGICARDCPRNSPAC